MVRYCRRYLSGARCKWPTQPRNLSWTGNEYRHIGMNNLPKVAMATSLSCRVSAIAALCRPITKTPSITNSVVAIIHIKPIIAILVPKLVAMATPFRNSKSAMSSSNRLTGKPTPRIKYRAASYHTAGVIAIRKPKSGCHGNVP